MAVANTETSDVRTEQPQNNTTFVTQDSDIPTGPEASSHEHSSKLSPKRQSLATSFLLVGEACHEGHHNKADSVERLELQQHHRHYANISTVHAAENSLPHPEDQKIRKRITGSPRANRDVESDSDQNVLPLVDSTAIQKKCNYMDGEVALVWDASLQDASDLSMLVMCLFNKMAGTFTLTCLYP